MRNVFYNKKEEVRRLLSVIIKKKNKKGVEKELFIMIRKHRKGFSIIIRE